jgi:hypothetical protein
MTGDFIRVRVVLGAACLASLVLWYLEKLHSLTWLQGTLLVVSLSSVTCTELFLAPRLKYRAGLAMLVTSAELLLIAWLAWFLPRLGR